jgi:DNA-binding CsgD family transcriptional regulator
VASFSHRDLSDALALVRAASLLRARATPFAAPVLARLARLIPGEAVGYHEREIVSHRLLYESGTPETAPPADVAEAAAMFCSEYPLSIQRHSRERRALKISDFVSCLQLHRLDYYQHALRPMGVEHQIRVWLPAPPGLARFLYINRARVDGDFGERDRELLELLRPYLAATRDRFDLGELPSVDLLTEREAEILAWVARGKTNKEIAALLVLSPHTVRSHLENTYGKLRVHTRTAAIARAFENGG